MQTAWGAAWPVVESHARMVVRYDRLLSVHHIHTNTRMKAGDTSQHPSGENGNPFDTVLMALRTNWPKDLAWMCTRSCRSCTALREAMSHAPKCDFHLDSSRTTKDRQSHTGPTARMVEKAPVANARLATVQAGKYASKGVTPSC